MLQGLEEVQVHSKFEVYTILETRLVGRWEQVMVQHYPIIRRGTS